MANNLRVFNRFVNITVGSTEVTGLDATFSITKQNQGDKQTNTCELIIYNLKEENRKVFQGTGDLRIEVSVGYSGVGSDTLTINDPAKMLSEAQFVCFIGHSKEVYSRKSGPDWETVIRIGDGVGAIQRARIQKSYKAGTPLKTILNEVIDSMDVSGDAAKKKINSTSNSKINSNVLKSYILSGPSHKELQKLLENTDLEASIQNEELIILEKTETNGTDILELSSDSGLIDSPEIVVRNEIKYLSFKSLILPGILPGKRIKIKSNAFDGFYKIDKVTYDGSTFGTEWYAYVEAIAV